MSGRIDGARAPRIAGARRVRRAGAARAWMSIALGVVVLLPAIRLPEVSQISGGDASLDGLPGVAVIAEQVSSEVRTLGITEEWIAGRVTTALRRDSIPLLTRSDAFSSDRQPLLVARLQTVRLPGRTAFAWYLSLAVHQMVVTRSPRSPAVLATTWEASESIGVSSASSLRATVGGTLDSQAAEFARAWRRRSATE